MGVMRRVRAPRDGDLAPAQTLRHACGELHPQEKSLGNSGSVIAEFLHTKKSLSSMRTIMQAGRVWGAGLVYCKTCLSLLNHPGYNSLINHTHKFDNGTANLVRVEVAIFRADFPVLHNGPALNYQASHLGHQSYLFIEVSYNISNMVETLPPLLKELVVNGFAAFEGLNYGNP
jgi:hypothetical protein